MTSYEFTHFTKMVRVWKTKSLLCCLKYDPLIVFRRQNHITFIFMKTMSHDLLVQNAYCGGVRQPATLFFDRCLPAVTTGIFDISRFWAFIFLFPWAKGHSEGCEKKRRGPPALEGWGAGCGSGWEKRRPRLFLSEGATLSWKCQYLIVCCSWNVF